MSILFGVDFYVMGGSRSDLRAALELVEPKISYLFFEHEEFDLYLKTLAVENLAVATEIGELAGLSSWKLDLEFTTPIPSHSVACALSRSNLTVARPRDETAEYSSHLVYRGGKLAYEAELEDEDSSPTLRAITR